MIKRIHLASLVAVALLPPVPRGLAQQPAAPKRLLTLYWYDRDYRTNSSFDLQFQAALQIFAPKGIEYYSEYLETNRFPGENQSLLLADYLRQKYAGREIDAIVTRASPPLDFLLRHRRNLFPHTPIIFATERPVDARVISEAGATGIVYANTHGRTLDLALKLHPGTKRIFIITGTLNHDKSMESVARNELQRYQYRAPITYLTDLTPDALTVAVKEIPADSIILYVWQQARNQEGKVLESRELLGAIAQGASAPIYGMSFANVGYGIVGGYVYTLEGNAAKLAQMTLRVANGARAADILVERAPETPMFDWRQLQRWGIRQDRLPPGSVIQFRELTVWQQYKWRIVGVTFVIALQALLIGALLVARQRARRTRLELEQYKEGLERLVEKRTAESVEARDQALAANRAKSIFLADMSHELRTPLNAILGFSGMVLRRASLSDQDRADLAIVGRSGEHLLGLIDEVLDMGKIETGRMTVESAAMDLHCLVNETIAVLRERAEAKNLQLLLDISSKVPQYIRSDAGKLRQVLTNLVGNAVKCTEDGRVTVRVDCRTDDDSPRRTLFFDVEDTGIGIAPDDQARIFDPFVQAGNARNTKGTGLGLGITRNFVQLLGGAIQVESSLGRGSRFRVEVPACAAEAVEAMAPDSSREQVRFLEPGQPDNRILIVEDQKDNWVLLQRLLQEAGFQVRVAEDGAQAVETYSEWRPHFIWMDLRLPVMGGLEAARRIRELDGGREVKIVALTASAFDSQREEVLAAGFDGFLGKPYSREQIFDYIAQHLGVRYVYRAGSEKTDGHLPLRPEDLATIPARLREELENAVISLNPQRIMAAVRQVSEHDATVGNVLKRFAGEYTYTPILDALQRCEKRSTQASP